MSTRVNTFIFMGRPGAGKGVQSALLSEKLGLPVFSTGGRMREMTKKDSRLGRKIKETQNSGGLTPGWFAGFIFQEAVFAKDDSQGMIFEGVGRTEVEARLFNDVHEWIGDDYLIFNLNVSDETVTQRLIKRGEMEGRADDVPEKIKVRLENFYKDTEPALNFFRSVGKVVEIDGEPLPEQVFESVLAHIEK